MMHGYGYGYAGGFGGPVAHGTFGLGLVGPIVGFGLLVVVGLVIWLIWSQRHHANNGTVTAQAPYAAPQTPVVPTAPVRDSAEDIARERFARGEIDRETYEAIVSALRS